MISHSDDTHYGIFNTKKEHNEPRYKYIRNEKDLNINGYVANFKQLPTNIYLALSIVMTR